MMAASDRPTTTLSASGWIVLPKAIREQRKWGVGTRLVVEDHPDGVLLRAAPVFAPTSGNDVFGSLPYEGRPKTLAEIDAGIPRKARRLGIPIPADAVHGDDG